MRKSECDGDQVTMGKLSLLAIVAFMAVVGGSSGGFHRATESRQFHVTRDTHSRQRGHNPRPNLAQLAEQLNLTEFVKVLESTNVGHTINHEGPYTVFAPTNEAFARIPDWAKQIPLGDLMKYHVARGDYLEKELKNNMLIRSLLSKRDVRINFYKGADGKQIATANGRTLNQTDFDAHNGVLHIIDDVMYAVYDREGSAFNMLPNLPFKTSMLVRALMSVDLDDVLNGQGPFTVFAPTDDAFAKLPDDVVQYLLKNETAMTQVLLHHVVPGVAYSAGLLDEMSLTAADGRPLLVTVSADGVKIGAGNVVLPNYTVSNGVIHVMDTVLIPDKMFLPTCFLNKLEAHLKKCNSRELPKPEYHVENANSGDVEEISPDDLQQLGKMSDPDVLKFIGNARLCHEALCGTQWKDTRLLSHKALGSELQKMQDCPGAMKHLCQIASILGNLERLCLLARRCTFVEFGAGRGAVSYWLSKVASESKKDSEVFLIDRASQRHKLDNRLKDGDEALGSVPVSRIKADIEHLVLDSLLDVPRLDTGSEDETRIVAVTKHLCGAATDFALRCLANSKIKDKSVCFATCCHHRCEWKSYVGKSVLQSYGFNASNFRVLCSLTSWLTCGSRKREEKLDPCSDEISQQRYAKLGFTVNESEEIGRICKDIIDAGRINYLKSVGFADANCCIYVPESVTPENVLLIAKTVNFSKWNKAPLAGYLVEGSNGEYVLLSDEERVNLIREARKYIPSDRLLIAGSGCQSTEATIEMSKKMAAVGADAVMVVTPGYYRNAMNDSALIKFYAAVADESPVPVILYSVPAYAGVDLSANSVAKLCLHDNIIGIKDSGGDVCTVLNFMWKQDIIVKHTKRNFVAKFALMVHLTEKSLGNRSFQVTAGSVSVLVPALVVGCVGTVSALANIIPEVVCKTFSLAKCGSWDDASALNRRLIQPNMAVTSQFGVAGLKAVMDAYGYYGGSVRRPLLSIDESGAKAAMKPFLENGF
ncbi:unnamed protein product [Notodromas monacha]|uniref:tRNA:m(4)X modification enzyme TRM13 n=1 Tax=Notodromas monacha TaxID=399045 RepID=A0A7R9G880_9CRUS|nr:unnamed protein product [Notodromas monacha]CAG0912999.1 unnamed protein product [Notodromas monacha]